MEQNKSDEIELFQVINSIKNTFRGWIISLFKTLEFIRKAWIVILVLIIAGVGYGYYKEAKTIPEKNIKSLIRINYNAVEYVYTSIELLNKKVKEHDNEFLKSIGIEPYSINSLELKPIIKIKQMVDQFDQNNRNLDVLLKNIEFDEDEVILSETFTTAYKNHVLVISTYTNSINTLDFVLDYINNNPLIEKVKRVGVLNLKSELESNKKTLSQIDKILDNYSKNQSLSSSSEQVFVVDKNFSIHILIDKKRELLKIVRQQEQDLIFGKNVVVSINQPELTLAEKGFFSNKKIIYPLVFVFAFLFLAYSRYTYFRLKKIVYQEVN